MAERVIRTKCNLLKKPVFEKGDANLLSELPSVIKQYNNTIQNSTEMIPIQASKKADEKKSIPIFKIEELTKYQILIFVN